MADGTILAGAKLLFDAYDLSAWVSNLSTPIPVKLQPSDVLDSTAKDRNPGTQAPAWQASGFYDGASGGPEPVLWPARRTPGKVVTVAKSGADGAVAYAMRGMAQFTPVQGGFGAMKGFGLAVVPSGGDGVVRGRIMTVGAKTADGAGTARQLGAVASGQYLYAWLHVTTVAGAAPSVVFKVQSDNAEGFPSADESLTFPAITAVGGYWATKVPGPIPNDWYRFSWDLDTAGGNTTSITAVGGVAIL